MIGVTRVLEVDNHLGEAPVWNHVDQALWWANCEKPAQLNRWVPATGERQTWLMPRRLGGFVHKADGGLLLALADGVYDFDIDSGKITLRAASPLPEHIKLHECQCDRQGRFWVGSMDHAYPADRSAAGGNFFRLDGDRLTPVIDNIAIANGLAFSPDGKILYAASSPWRKAMAYNLNSTTGGISDGREFVNIDDNGPISGGFLDGATVDGEGGYWLAIVGNAELRRYLPDGSLDRIVPLPFSNPTKPAFGGSDMQTLYITSTKMVLNPENPLNIANGDIFALTPGVQGIAETPFSVTS